MKLHNLEKETHFFICNQYQLGEFVYLGDNKAIQLSTNQIAAINGHTVVEIVEDGEIIVDKIKFLE